MYVCEIHQLLYLFKKVVLTSKLDDTNITTFYTNKIIKVIIQINESNEGYG